MPSITNSACSAFCCYSYDWEYWWRLGEVPTPPLTCPGDSEVPLLMGWNGCDMRPWTELLSVRN